jgi:ubiquinone/menaquinone biosynthesis C-methylase UbiE
VTDRYVPAAGRRAFTRLYDPVVALTTRERRFRALLRERVLAALPARGTVVDVGCGTGTFAIALAEARPDATVIGVDGDTGVLALARAKPGAERVDWREGLAGQLDVRPARTDAVVMSLLLHHLQPDAKRAALAEAQTILKPGGTLHVADWGRPHDPLMRVAFRVLQAIDGVANTRDHADGRLPSFICAAGFEDVRSYARLRTAFGSLELLYAKRSGSPANAAAQVSVQK